MACNAPKDSEVPLGCILEIVQSIRNGEAVAKKWEILEKASWTLKCLASRMAGTPDLVVGGSMEQMVALGSIQTVELHADRLESILRDSTNPDDSSETVAGAGAVDIRMILELVRLILALFAK